VERALVREGSVGRPPGNVRALAGCFDKGEQAEALSATGRESMRYSPQSKIADPSRCLPALYDGSHRTGKMQSLPTERRRSIGGLVVRRECWALTPLGRLVSVAILAAIVLGSLRVAYPFLAVTDRAQGQVLVVEGWSPEYTVREAASEFRRGRYQHVLVVKAVYDTPGEAGFDCGTSGQMARLLVRNGVPPRHVHAIYYPPEERDRTYHAALAVKHWLSEHGAAVRSIDVATKGAHARRSRVLYEKAFGPGVRIGVIALRDRAYEPEHWWRSSEGIREVPFQALAYLYARFLFSERASNPPDIEKLRRECEPRDAVTG
jgi:DUF218 domain